MAQFGDESIEKQLVADFFPSWLAMLYTVQTTLIPADLIIIISVIGLIDLITALALPGANDIGDRAVIVPREPSMSPWFDLAIIRSSKCDPPEPAPIRSSVHGQFKHRE